MEFFVSRRSAAVVGLWLTLVGVIAATPFWKHYFFTTLCTLAVYVCAVLLVCVMHFSTYRVRVGKHHLTLRGGLLFRFTKRMPLRFISGCYLLSTPLQRRLKVCVLILYSSAGITCIPGAPLTPAQALCALLTQGDGV